MPVVTRPPKRKLDLSYVAEAVDAAGIGARKASKVLSSFTASVGLPNVMKGKLQGAIEKSRQEKIQAVSDKASHCYAVFCDGRDDQTVTCVELDDGSQKHEATKVHNISVNMHPGDVHIGHFTCEGRHTGAAVAHKLYEFLQKRGIDIAKVLFVGGDGTSSVVGLRNGWMANFEELVGRPLGRVICLCHQAELPYRTLFHLLDGGTTGPSTFSGPIGKCIAWPVHSLPVTDFERVDCVDFPTMPSDVESGLSSDLKLLYQCANAVVTGDAGKVAKKTHGKLHNARWHTAQSRLLRCYMSVRHPSESLSTLARYIVCVYVPTVISVKSEWDVVCAPKHLAEEIRRQQECLSGEELEAELNAVQESMQRNAYMAHPENIVLAMLGDTDKTIRAEAINLITEARQHSHPSAIRRFQAPKVNFGAQTYIGLTNIRQAATVKDIEPPYVKQLSDSQLAACLEVPLKTEVPNNTQSTERAVKLTTEAAAAVMHVDRQDGYALNRRAFRQRCPGQVTRASFRSPM